MTHDLYGPPPGDRTLLLLHGIFANRTGWRTFAGALAAALPGWSVVAVDHRNHGEHHDATGPDTVDACADDLAAFAATLGVVPRATVGHSFGGKVVLRHAERYPDGLRQVWVLDAPPGPGPRGNDDAEMMTAVAAMLAIPMPAPRRDLVVDALRARGVTRPFAAWLSTALVRGPDGWSWRFDLPRCAAMLEDYFTVDGWPTLSRPRDLPRIDVLRAGRSDRWDADTLARFDRLPEDVPTRLHTLPDAGHWVHVDDPDAVIARIVGSLRGPGSRT